MGLAWGGSTAPGLPGGRKMFMDGSSLRKQHSRVKPPPKLQLRDLKLRHLNYFFFSKGGVVWAVQLTSDIAPPPRFKLKPLIFFFSPKRPKYARNVCLLRTLFGHLPRTSQGVCHCLFTWGTWRRGY